MRHSSEHDSRNAKKVPVPNVVPVERMPGEDEEDTALLRQMLADARAYLKSFSWAGSIDSSYFAGGVGKIFAIFLFNIVPTRPDADSWMWIVVGDIPSAYLSLADCKSTMDVFEAYIEGMTRWVKLARQGRMGRPEVGIPPVNVPATPEWAESLGSRLRFLTEMVKPQLES